jgi:hypothetical protein
LESYQIEAFKCADKGAMLLSGTSRRFAALLNLVSIAGIADMAGLAAGSTRSRMTRPPDHSGATAWQTIGDIAEELARLRYVSNATLNFRRRQCNPLCFVSAIQYASEVGSR